MPRGLLLTTRTWHSLFAFGLALPLNVGLCWLVSGNVDLSLILGLIAALAGVSLHAAFRPRPQRLATRDPQTEIRRPRLTKAVHFQS